MQTRFIPILLFLFLILSACAPQASGTPLSSETPTQPPAPLPSPTPAPRSLTVCLGDEPTSLYPYGSLSSSARSVLSAIYDGPMNVRNYEYEPVILEKIPNIEDGDAQVATVSVKAGDQVVDSTGAVVTLNTGIRVRPKDCRNDSCAIAYDGSSSVQMDQMVVTFILLKGLLWSDGEPLTAAGFHLFLPACLR